MLTTAPLSAPTHMIDPWAPPAPKRRRDSRPYARPRARSVTSALHHASALSRSPISAAVPRPTTTLQALGAERARERARARPAAASRSPD